MKHILTSFLLGLALLSPAAYAQATKQTVLVELFASQNCPACPRAHRTMREIAAEKPEALILTWSVNYWDYLGNPDPMALPEAKLRQAAYAENLGLRAPYTPQSIYNGTKECPGTRKRAVRKNIKTLTSNAPDDIQLSYAENTVELAPNAVDGPLQISLIEFLDDSEHDTGMVNPVTAFTPLDAWSGEAKRLDDVTCTNNCAILVHIPNSGTILSFLLLK